MPVQLKVGIMMVLWGAVLGQLKQLKMPAFEHEIVASQCVGHRCVPNGFMYLCGMQVLQTPLGTFQQMQTCQACMGSGERRTPCDACGGDGRVRKSKRISLTIPGGVEDGTRLRVSSEGNAGRRGGPPGDLYVAVGVKDHPELRREGMTIYSDVTVRPCYGILCLCVQ